MLDEHIPFVWREHHISQCILQAEEVIELHSDASTIVPTEFLLHLKYITPRTLFHLLAGTELALHEMDEGQQLLCSGFGLASHR